MRRPGSFSGPEEAIDFAELFANANAPLEVDLGCGDGLFLSTRAADNPTRNFLGIERLIGRVRTSCRRIDRLGLKNARIIRIDIAHSVKSLLPVQGVDAFYLLFPDPWPKRRHQTRRVFNAELLDGIAAALKPTGTFYVATDQPELCRYQKPLPRSSFPQHTPADQWPRRTCRSASMLPRCRRAVSALKTRRVWWRRFGQGSGNRR